MLPIFSESTAPGLGTASQTDMAFNFMPGAGHNHQSAAGCTSTQFIEYNFTHAHKKSLLRPILTSTFLPWRRGQVLPSIIPPATGDTGARCREIESH
jgi:hypothetical protein